MDEIVNDLQEKLKKAIGCRLIDGELSSEYLTVSAETELWKKRSIYRVPSSIINSNESDFTPKVVSLGPYHHGKDELKRMEQHKIRALGKVLIRSGRVHLLGWLNNLKEIESQLRDHYEQLEHPWLKEENNFNFIKMMLVDGCFMLEILRTYDPYQTKSSAERDYSKNDPIFGNCYMMGRIWRDLLLLENQLPLLLLEELLVYEAKHTNVKYYVRELVVKFLQLKEPIQVDDYMESQHLLDMYRRSMVKKEGHLVLQSERQLVDIDDGHGQRTQYSTKKDHKSSMTIPHRAYHVEDGRVRHMFSWSAEMLQSSGIRLKASPTCLMQDMSSHNGVFSLPAVAIDKSTKCLFLNLMAFERCHGQAYIGSGKQVTNYIALCMSLVNSPNDLKILTKNQIICNFLADEKDTLEVIRLLREHAAYEKADGTPDLYVEIATSYRNRMKWWKILRREWVSDLYQTYLRNPWTFISVFGAIILLGLTLTQTIYTVFTFYAST